MSRSQRPDKNSLRRGGQPWVYQPIACGTSEVGWKAGQPLGVWTHFSGVTKPCRRRTTNSVLTCHFCEGKHVPVWRGYFPYYDREYQCRFVLITEEYEEATCEIPHLAPIRLARGKNKRDCVVVRREEKPFGILPHNPKRERMVDLWEALLCVWKDAEIAAWSAANPVAVEPEKTLSPVRPPTPKQKQKAEQLANRVSDLLHVRDGDELRPISEVFPSLAAKAASKNGKH